MGSVTDSGEPAPRQPVSRKGSSGESFSSATSVVCAGLSSSSSRSEQLCAGSHGLRVVGEVKSAWQQVPTELCLGEAVGRRGWEEQQRGSCLSPGLVMLPGPASTRVTVLRTKVFEQRATGDFQTESCGNKTQAEQSPGIQDSL